MHKRRSSVGPFMRVLYLGFGAFYSALASSPSEGTGPFIHQCHFHDLYVHLYLPVYWVRPWCDFSGYDGWVWGWQWVGFVARALLPVYVYTCIYIHLCLPVYWAQLWCGFSGYDGWVWGWQWVGFVKRASWDLISTWNILWQRSIQLNFDNCFILYN